MKIAIHDLPGSFSDRWVKYCDEKKIPYKLVNCYDSDIMAQLDDCTKLMWHWNQNDYKAALFAHQFIISLEKRGVKVFPDVNTSWHYNDKLGQKYLLEAIGAPLVKSYAFYTKREAFAWVKETTFPKVFKLRGGAASVNVSLVKTKATARRFIRQAFGSGFSPINHFARINDRLRVLKRDKNLAALRGVISGFARIFIYTEVERFSPKEKGYVYAQDFIPGNEYDTRLIVIGNRCFGGRRYCREGDFRASGSGMFSVDPALIDKKCVRSAFATAKRLQTQSVAFDFILDNGEAKIIEISYCFPTEVYDNCPGYWDIQLKWHETTINPQYFMIEDFIKSGSKQEYIVSHPLRMIPS